MDVLLDTCTILWNASGEYPLSEKASRAIDEAYATGGLYISSITIWEIAWLINNKRLNIGIGYSDFMNDILKSYSYGVFDITPEIADIATTLPSEINSDPADRIIAATSIVKKVPLVTADKNLRKSKLVKTIW